MKEEKNKEELNSISNTLFFTSLINSSFDYSIPLKLSFNRFCKENRGEATKNLFEYLCFKIVEKQIEKNGINEQIAIISEKFLSSKECINNLSKLNYSQKKFIFIPICHAVTHKWNAIIFVHLERQILQYLNKTNTEPIVAKIISSNINSEEDDYLLNTTMDKIENAFNFTSPEDIQFEVDSINICDQPNTSIFLLNFIEGLISQENNTDSIMNYIMKLYDESSNTNSIGSNNYFVSFNKENEIFPDLIPNYINEIKIYAKNNGIEIKDNNDDINNTNIFDLIKFRQEEEEEIESEEEALKIVAKDNEEALKQMEEQELFFSNNINIPFNLNLEELNNVPPKTILGLIQEVEDESDEDTEQKNNSNNNSLIKKEDVNIDSDEEEENNNIEINDNNNEIKEENNEIKEDNNNEKENLNKETKENNNEPILIIEQNNKEEKLEKEENIKKEENKKEIEDIKKGKMNNIMNNISNYRNIKSEKIVNENMSKLSNNLEKIKNEIINNLTKENNKVLRGSHHLKNDVLENVKINEGTNEKFISKSLYNNNIPENNNENKNIYNVINHQRNQKYNNSSFYESKGTKEKQKNKNNLKNKKKEENLIISSNNTNYLEDKSNIIMNNQKKEIKNNMNNIIIENKNNNNIIIESNYNKMKNINTNIINNINDKNIKSIKKLKGKTELKTNTQINQKNRGNNTIIINETSNNNTVINFIEIKNNFESNNSNSDNENEIPEDGITNKIIETFSPNKTLSGMKKDIIDNDYLINKNKTYKGKSSVNLGYFSDSNQNDIKLTLLNDYLYGNDYLNSENNNVHHSVNQINDFNLIDKIKNEKEEQNININNNLIGKNSPKRTIRKLKYKSGPEKNNNINREDNIDLLKDYKTSNNCSLNMANDLNCGCTGIDNGCFIF